MRRVRRPGRPRAVVDTNLVVSGLILKRGSPFELVEALRQGALTLLISEALRVEYERVLRKPQLAQRYNLTTEEISAFLFLVDTTGRRVVPRRRLPVVVRDPLDEHVLATALGGKADYLVTGDDDLLELASHLKLGSLKIVTVKALLDILQR